MTTDEIMALADLYAEKETHSRRCSSRDKLKSAIEALVSTEREACAKVCDSLTMNIDVFDTMDAVTPINLRCATHDVPKEKTQ